jgi:TRAP-type mannitol/chloroaromatic compound transport system permease small subunit
MLQTSLLSFIDNLSEWSGRVVSVLIYGVLLTLVYEVFARYVFNAPTIWAHESSAFFFGTYFMLGAAYCFRHEGMISVDIIYRHLPKRTQAVLNLITFAFFLAICLTLIWIGGIDALDSWQAWENSNSTWAPPLYPIKTMIPIGALLLLLQGIAKFVRDASIAFTGKELGEYYNDRS